MYTWTITKKTMDTLTNDHRATFYRMIHNLNSYYEKCEEIRDFSTVHALVNAFRDIILAWPLDEFSVAYDELNEWEQSFLYGR